LELEAISPSFRRRWRVQGDGSCLQTVPEAAEIGSLRRGHIRDLARGARDNRIVFDHVTIRVSDRAASERFYKTVLLTLGIEQSHMGEHYGEWDDFSVSQAGAEKPVTRRLHVAFVAPSRAHVDEFWRAGTEAGYADDGEPGPRPQYSEDYYGAFLLDPDGSSVEAVYHGNMRTDGWIDHLWIRVADLPAARRFYETVAPFAGFRLKGEAEAPNRAHFAGESGSFSVVDDGPPTENVHLAFPAGDDETVNAFHRAATEAGYRDQGAPGERPVYHAGYYGAYVLDPDGNNVEVVNHNR
jgi:catechol 2,3-dioxygenase-like lactoylglutathione lyase family enzyme